MTTTGTARVVLVEDDPAIRMVVEILLSTEPDLELVGTAVCAEEGIALVRHEAPDLLLLDNQLEGPLTGVAAAPAFKDAFPGVLVLSAFLLTVPFAQQFHRLGSADRTLFAAGLVSAALSVIAFLTPVWLHRFGRRTERAVRLAVSVIATRVGFVCFLGSLALVMLVVCRFLFDDLIAFAIVGATSALAPVMWGLVPAVVRRRRLALAAMTKSGGDA